MHKITLPTIGLALASILFAVSAHAQNAVSYIATTGSDIGRGCSNSTTDACRSAGPAIFNTNDGGQIVCVDSGDFRSPGGGAIVVSKSLTIDCAGTSAILHPLSISTAGVVLTVRNVTILPTNGSGDALFFAGGAALIVENCAFRNHTLSGIRFIPSTASQLFVKDSAIDNINSANALGGLFIQPTGSGSAQVTVERTSIENSSLGIVVDGTSSGGTTKAFIRDSVIAGINGPGVAAKGSTVSADRSQIVNNNFGVIANNGGSALLSNSTIQGNGTAFAVAGGAAIFSYGNNNINANGAFGSALTVIGQH
jgi:hypothetical protein